MTRTAGLTLVAVLALFQGCALFSKKERPIDIASDAPSVADVIAQVQAAIDATAQNPGWEDTEDYAKAVAACTDGKKAAAAKHELQCDAVYSNARGLCAEEKAQTAAQLCGDYLREAAAACGSPPAAPPVCAAAEQIGPVRLKSAKFKFTAAVAKEGNLGGALKLVTAKQARSYGRTSSYEIEMVPKPIIVTQKDRGSVTVGGLDNLSAILTSALNAATNCKADPRTPGKQECVISKAPQLILKSATYSVEITYSKKTELGWEWTVSSLKISEGAGGYTNENKLGNTLTLVLER